MYVISHYRWKVSRHCLVRMRQRLFSMSLVMLFTLCSVMYIIMEYQMCHVTLWTSFTDNGALGV